MLSKGWYFCYNIILFSITRPYSVFCSTKFSVQRKGCPVSLRPFCVGALPFACRFNAFLLKRAERAFQGSKFSSVIVSLRRVRFVGCGRSLEVRRTIGRARRAGAEIFGKCFFLIHYVPLEKFFCFSFAYKGKACNCILCGRLSRSKNKKRVSKVPFR